MPILAVRAVLCRTATEDSQWISSRCLLFVPFCPPYSAQSSMAQLALASHAMSVCASDHHQGHHHLGLNSLSVRFYRLPMTPSGMENLAGALMKESYWFGGFEQLCVQVNRKVIRYSSKRVRAVDRGILPSSLRRVRILVYRETINQHSYCKMRRLRLPTFRTKRLGVAMLAVGLGRVISTQKGVLHTTVRHAYITLMLLERTRSYSLLARHAEQAWFVIFLVNASLQSS